MDTVDTVDTMESTSTTAMKQRPMAWDVLSPATLLLPTMSPSTHGDGSGQGQTALFHIDTFLSHDGVGCNDHEESAIMHLLDAQEGYYSNNDKEQKGEWAALKALSKSYRRALRDCSIGWEESQLLKSSDYSNGNELRVPATEYDNLELLKLVYAITHLSEVYLLLPPPLEGGTFEDTSNMQGAVTADTVRYLRLHHMADPYSSENVEEMLSSPQPEQVNSEMYWKLVRTFVTWGCLDEAWAVLSRHSACQRCFASDASNTEILDNYHAAVLEEDRDGFLALQAILLSAPLPGGRNDEHDAGLDSSNDTLIDQEDTAALLNGVPRSAYKLWETASNEHGNTSQDIPLSYNPHAAKSAHSAWSKFVTSLQPLDLLVTRIPQLQPILSILRGNLQNTMFDSWSEALCAELLYLRPALRPSDLHVRTARVMEKFGVANAGFDGVILSVMQGTAGRVVEVLHKYGGGSGAALPATMTSLLCNLLTEAKHIDSAPSNHICIQTELLLSASHAILSSLSSSTKRDVGVRLSTRLLLPFALPAGDVRVAATLGETLQRHAPQTDAEARSLLALCRTLVEKKSMRVLDGCVNLCLCRYRFFMADQRPGGAIHWLFQGIEIERLMYASSSLSKNCDDWQCVLASGTCGRFVVKDCVMTSKLLISGLLDESSSNLGNVFGTAKEMTTSIRKDELFARMIPEVKLLFHVYDIARAVVEGEGNEALACNIVACLEDIPNDQDGGVVSVLAHPSMYQDLLSLAQTILIQDEGRCNDGGSNERFKSSFDVNGMHILLRKFTQVTLRNERKKEEEEDTNSPLRLALCTGLMRAFVSENAQRGETFMAKSVDASARGILSPKLASYSQSDQELAVEMMLDPSM